MFCSFYYFLLWGRTPDSVKKDPRNWLGPESEIPHPGEAVVPVRAMVTLWHSWVLEQGFVDRNLFYNDIFFDVKRKCRYRTSSRLENPVVEFNLSQCDRSCYWDNNFRWGTSLGAPWHRYLSAYLEYSTHESLLAGLHSRAIRFNKQDCITTEKCSNPCNSVPPLLGEGTMEKVFVKTLPFYCFFA